MKFRNDPAMTRSVDAGESGLVVVDSENGETDLCLRFDVENVSLIELSRASTGSSSSSSGGGEKAPSSRSITESPSSAHTPSPSLPPLPPSGGDKILEKDAGNRDSGNALANGHESPPPSSADRASEDFLSPQKARSGLRDLSNRRLGQQGFRLSASSNGKGRGEDESTSEFAASLNASNGYVGWLPMSQVAPLEPRDSRDDETSGAPADEISAPLAREEASGCSSSSSDEDGQQQQRREQRQLVEKEVEQKEEEVIAEPDQPLDLEDQVTSDNNASEEKLSESPIKSKEKKSARKSVRFRDDDDLVDAAADEKEADDSDASSTRERPDGASSEESVDAEGPKGRDVNGEQSEFEDDDDEEKGETKKKKMTKKPRGILKRPADKGKRKNRVTFNELMTVFADGYPEVQVPAFRPWDLTDILCFAYEPPPGYRDWDAFDPPAEYMDLVEASMGVTTFHGEDDESVDNPDGSADKISSEEMMEIYRTEFEYSADAVDEPNDFPVVKVDYSFDTSEILENQEIAPTDDEADEVEKPETEAVEDADVETQPLTPTEEEIEPVSNEEENKMEEVALDDESPLDSPVRDDDDSVSVDEPSRYRSKHGAVTDNEDSGPDDDDLSGDEIKECVSTATLEMKPLELKPASESEPESTDQPLTPTTERELESGDEYHNAASKMMARTNSQIRKSIEMNALRRSLLKGSDVCRRRNPSGVTVAAQRPKSPTTSSLEEKLRWLTSTEDLTMTHNYQEPEPVSYVQEEPAVSNEAETINRSSNTTPHPTAAPPRQSTNFPPPHYIIQPRPTRWSSELLYSSPAASASSASSSSSSTGSSYDNRPQLPSFRPPPSRPCSFDPTMGALAWEGYLQRDKYGGYGGSSLSLMRAPYVCTVERHPNAANYPGNNASGGPNRGPRDPNNPTSDELEWFVQRDLERIERIKKRYSLTEEEDPTFGFGRRPSVRGIRPRFGSTSEILQQLQAQMRPPRPFSAVGPRGPWPNCVGPPRPTGPRPNQPMRQSYPSQQQQQLQQQRQQAPPQYQPPRQQNYYGPPVQQPTQATHPRTVVVLPRVSEEGGPLPHIVRVRSKHDHAFLIPNGVLFGQHTKANAGTATNAKDERGAPEGASSSPKVSSDSLYPQNPQQQQAHHGQPRAGGHGGAVIGGTVPNAQRTPMTTSASDTNQKEAVIYYSLRV